MTLHEIYATLLRRGMPRRTWLSCQTDGWRLRSERASDGEWVISESDAADLLTMHALRWLNGGTLRMRHGVACDGEALVTLEYIAEETEHLEPK